MIYESFSKKDTFNIAYQIAKQSNYNQVYSLHGELGAGKTIFAKGFGLGLNISEEITSPTFNIVNEYLNGKCPFYHFDVYRINDISEIEETNYEEYFYSNSICLVEWGQIIKNVLPKNTIYINIEKNLLLNDDYRKIIIVED